MLTELIWEMPDIGYSSEASSKRLLMEHFYRNVLGLGNVAVSRHAQERIEAENISVAAFERALLWPSHPDVYDGQDVLWREHNGIRLVILLNPTPNRGAVLVKTVYRVNTQAMTRLK